MPRVKKSANLKNWMVFSKVHEVLERPTSGHSLTAIGDAASGHSLPYLTPVDVTRSVPPSGTEGGEEQNLAAERKSAH